MGFRIQNNITALNAQRNLSTSDAGMSKSLERLSSGYRINSAKDDAAGLAISQGFRADIASVKVAQRNISEANALLQTAEGAMNSVSDILTRMKELATQAASANVGGDRDKISSEYDSLVLEIDRISDSTKYAGVNLVDGTFGGGTSNTSTSWDAIDNVYDVNVANATVSAAYTVDYVAGTNSLTITLGGDSETETLGVDGAQTVNFASLGISFKISAAGVSDTVGAAMAAAEIDVDAGVGSVQNFQIGYEKDADNNSQLGVAIDNIDKVTLGVDSGDIFTASGAYNALTLIDDAIDTLATSRGELGAYQNRLGYAASNLSITLENFTAAESAIRDVDMATEMTSFTKNQILVQAGTAMLAQANMAPQQVLSLLKG
ncbi:MAG: flagellin [Pseudomonadota bacterium]